MQRPLVRRPYHVGAVFTFSLFLAGATSIAQSREHVLHAFTAPAPNCFGPAAPLVADAAGNLYGTTTGGGVSAYGCVFELSPTNSGWTETVLYNFSSSDGAYPASALIFDQEGNLYGTTERGGANDSGVVFELSPSGEGWTETVLHSFGSGSDGIDPQSNLIFDNAGNLYGTTTGSGGDRRGGAVYELMPGNGGWTESLLYSFPASISGPDGDNPAGGVAIDGAGNLYGNTAYGGATGNGAVFQLSPSNGGYKERVIYSFNGYDGAVPSSTLVLDSGGRLYGTTSFGGDTSACYLVGCGLVFELTKQTKGSWTENVLHAMTVTDGSYTLGPVVFDGSGRLYAAAEQGGIGLGMGSVFMLTPTTSGPWKESLLHRFNFQFPNGTDGESPYAGVILNHGRIFGTTLSGGVFDGGTLFELTEPGK